MRTDAEILRELQQRKMAGTLSPDDSLLEGDSSPLSAVTIEEAEQRLGFQLPELLRAIFQNVSNGGFGEAYGFMGLIGGLLNEHRMDSVTFYEALRQPDSADPYWEWPRGLLPLCHLGCAMYHCVDCTKENAPVHWFEPNPHEEGDEWSDAFIPFCDSLNEYMSAWLDGVDLWGKFR